MDIGCVRVRVLVWITYTLCERNRHTLARCVALRHFICILLFVERVSIRATRYHFCSTNMNKTFPFVFGAPGLFPCAGWRSCSLQANATNQVVSLWLYGCVRAWLRTYLLMAFTFNRFRLDGSLRICSARFSVLISICAEYVTSVDYIRITWASLPRTEKYLATKFGSTNHEQYTAQTFPRAMRKWMASSSFISRCFPFSPSGCLGS